MARPQETFNKKELEKKRLQKRKEKAQRKEERKANAKDGRSFEDMIAYVDEYGNISSTPPDPTKKKQVIKESEILIGARKNESTSPSIRKGKVSFYNHDKGFGFINDLETSERIFVHYNELNSPVVENDTVTFQTKRGPKGLMAVDVKVVK